MSMMNSLDHSYHRRLLPQAAILTAEWAALRNEHHTTKVDEHTRASSQRSVKFSGTVEVHPIINRHEMSNDEIFQVWSSHRERLERKQEVDNTIFLMKSGVGLQLTEDDFFCSRGLENYLDKSRTRRVRKSQQIALAMQRLLRKAGATSPDLIARAYRKYTFKSQRMAYNKALHDHVTANGNY